MKIFHSAEKHLRTEIEKRFGGRALGTHSLSVAELCVKIAEDLGRPDEERVKILLAALGHDLFRGYSERGLREYIQARSVPVDSSSWRFGRGLLHAPVAAHYLRTRVELTDREILTAVYYHTTGRAGATVMDKILFCADYLDTSRIERDNEEDLGPLRERVSCSLDEVYREVILRKITHTMKKGRPIHPNALAAWNEVYF
ncbi:MAG: HD domain-containing protein [Gemmatimonadota bacterium]|nr:HD domain-containing protein [Gemmatimonadota bacterium]